MASLLPQLHHDSRVSFFGREHVFVSVWSDAPTVAQMQALEQHGRAFEQKHGPAALISIAADGTPKFSDDVRKLASEYTRDSSLFQLARAHVILMRGLSGVAVRSFINTFLMLGRSPRPTRMLASVESAAVWLQPHLGHTSWTQETLRDDILAVVTPNRV